MITFKNLRADFLSNPLAVGSTTPQLSWELASDNPVPPLTEARIRVFEAPIGGSPEGARAVWDSGWSVSSIPIRIYQGPHSGIGQRMAWQVQVRCEDEESGWSEFGFWEWGPLEEEEWQDARWIGACHDQTPKPWPATWMKTDFACKASISQARLYVSGLGCSEIWLNGRQMDAQAFLEPAESDYTRFAYYCVYDVTAFLQEGGNHLGVVLGDSWYNQDRVWTGKYYPRGVSYGDPGLRLLLRIHTVDGASFSVVSDERWRHTLEGPVRSSNVFAGEVHDARRELGDWTGQGGDTSGPDWNPVRILPPRAPRLIPQLIPPIRKKETFFPASKNSPLPGVWVFDFGKMIAGICRLRVNLPRGTELCLRFAESLACDGTPDFLSTGYLHTGVIQTDRYICRGGGEEVWEPRFTYHGFQYVELTGYPGEPPPSVLEAVVVHTDLRQAGEFSCSDELVNQIQETALRTIRGNLHGVLNLTVRERNCWLGDTHLLAEALIFQYDAVNFFQKYQRDILQSLGTGERPYCGYPLDARVPSNAAPGKRSCQQGRPDWALAMVFLPWYLYVYYGDLRTAAESFSAMCGLMDFWEEVAREGILEDGFGDWCPPGENGPSKTCPSALTSTALWHQAAECMRHMAMLLGHEAKAAHYEALRDRIRKAFVARFFDPADGGFGSQTGDVMALAFGLCEESRRAALADRLARRIREEQRGHFDTGIIGLKFLFEALAENGLDSLCMDLLQQEGYPGFRHLLSLGATTFWEVFYDPEEFHLGEERSKNHPMQTGFIAWFFRGLGGLRPDPDHPGFGHFFLEPKLVGRMQSVTVRYDSLRGEIISSWAVRDGEFLWHVEIPCGSRATVVLPKGVQMASLSVHRKAGGRELEIQPHVHDGSRISLGSGHHRIQGIFQDPPAGRTA